MRLSADRTDQDDAGAALHAARKPCRARLAYDETATTKKKAAGAALGPPPRFPLSHLERVPQAALCPDRDLRRCEQLAQVMDLLLDCVGRGIEPERGRCFGDFLLVDESASPHQQSFEYLVAAPRELEQLAAQPELAGSPVEFKRSMPDAMSQPGLPPQQCRNACSKLDIGTRCPEEVVRTGIDACGSIARADGGDHDKDPLVGPGMAYRCQPLKNTLVYGMGRHDHQIVRREHRCIVRTSHSEATHNVMILLQQCLDCRA